MADILDSIVVDFGDDAGIEAVILADDLKNREVQGITDEEESPSPLQDKDFYFLCQLPSGYEVDDVKWTDSRVDEYGEVTRSNTEDSSFFPDESEKTLELRPHGTVTAAYYGNSSTFDLVEEKGIVANSPPVIADLTYSFKAYSFKIRAIDKADWPVGVVIYAKEKS